MRRADRAAQLCSRQIGTHRASTPAIADVCGGTSARRSYTAENRLRVPPGAAPEGASQWADHERCNGEREAEPEPARVSGDNNKSEQVEKDAFGGLKSVHGCPFRARDEGRRCQLAGALASSVRDAADTCRKKGRPADWPLTPLQAVRYPAVTRLGRHAGSLGTQAESNSGISTPEYALVLSVAGRLRDTVIGRRGIRASALQSKAGNAERTLALSGAAHGRILRPRFTRETRDNSPFVAL